VPLSILLGTPFDLSIGENVYAKLVASNIFGDSLESSAAGGAIIIGVPNPPQDLSEIEWYRDATTLGL